MIRSTLPIRHSLKRPIIDRMTRQLAARGRRLGGVLCTVLLCGCVGSQNYLVEVDGTVPEPLVDPLPYRVGVYYSPAFSAYTSKQESISGDTWQVAFNDLQQRYVQKMLVSAFDEVVISETDTPQPTDAERFDFLLVPRIDNFSFLTPAESGSKFFAVSMRHYVDFIGVDGTRYGAWEINSYGRSRDSFGRAIRELALEACLDAMRDLATSIIYGLPSELVNRGVINAEQSAHVAH